MNTTRVLVPTVALASAILLTTGAPALAKGGGNDVRTAGTCQGGAHWKMKAKADDGAIEVEAEVDSNRSGQTWKLDAHPQRRRSRLGHAQDGRRAAVPSRYAGSRATAPVPTPTSSWHAGPGPARSAAGQFASSQIPPPRPCIITGVTVRVLVVDDHTMVRLGLVQLIATTDDLEVVGEAATGVEAVARAAELEPDVVLMDLQMPEMDGVRATREIVSAGRSQVLVLTSFSDTDRIVDVLDAGAVGYILKDTDPEELLEAVRSVVPRRLTTPPASRPAAAHRPQPGPFGRAETSPPASGRCSSWCVRAWPTSRSPAASASASGPSRPTSPRCSTRSASRTGRGQPCGRNVTATPRLPDLRGHSVRRQSPPRPLPMRTTPMTSSSTLITAALLCCSHTRSSSSGARSRSLATR